MQTECCHGNLQPHRRLFVSSLTFQEICILLKPPSLIRFLKYNIMLLEGIRPLIWLCVHVSARVWGSACVNGHPAAARRPDKGTAACGCPAGAAGSTWVERLGRHTRGGILGVEGAALPSPLSAGSFPLRLGKNCAFAAEDCGGDAVAPAAVSPPASTGPCLPLRSPLGRTRQPSFGHCCM